MHGYLSSMTWVVMLGQFEVCDRFLEKLLLSAYKATKTKRSAKYLVVTEIAQAFAQ